MRLITVLRRETLATILGALVAAAVTPGIARAQTTLVVTEPANHWMAAGFVGSSFSARGDLPAETSTNDGGVTVGFQLGYVSHYLGGEFIGDFAPAFKLASLALTEHPSVNSFMFNLLGMLPLGAEERFQPYVSGGLGGVAMHTTLRTLPGTSTVFATDDGTIVAFNTSTASQTKFGTNIGGGFFAYAGHWGVRGDIRYYNVSTNDTGKINLGDSTAENFTQALLSGLNYWRANLGVAYRW